MTAAGEPEESAEPATPTEGLSTSYGAFQTVRDDDYAALFAGGMVVLDANILLNLYRYTPAARNDFLKVLQWVRDRLWIPRQVAHEFWKNRDKVIGEAQRTADDAIVSLKDLESKIDEAINGWVNRISLPAERISEQRAHFSAALESLQIEMLKLGAEHGLHGTAETQTDPVLKELEPILDGKVGPPLSSVDLAKAVTEGERRNREAIPPGYKDKSKTENPTGDYILWEQTLREAERRRVDVLIVTNDSKEDWWRKDRGQIRGPRAELHEELRLRCGVRLFMMRPQTFLKHANKFLKFKVAESTIDQIEWVDDGLIAAEAYMSRALAERDSITKFHAHLIRKFSVDRIQFKPASNRGWGDFTVKVDGGPEYIFDVVRISARSPKRFLIDKIERVRRSFDHGEQQAVILFLDPPNEYVESFLDSNGVAAIWWDADGWTGNIQALTTELL